VELIGAFPRQQLEIDKDVALAARRAFVVAEEHAAQAQGFPLGLHPFVTSLARSAPAKGRSQFVQLRCMWDLLSARGEFRASRS
jgi:hypothetical protein